MLFVVPLSMAVKDLNMTLKNQPAEAINLFYSLCMVTEEVKRVTEK